MKPRDSSPYCDTIPSKSLNIDPLVHPESCEGALPSAPRPMSMKAYAETQEARDIVMEEVDPGMESEEDNSDEEEETEFCEFKAYLYTAFTLFLRWLC